MNKISSYVAVGIMGLLAAFQVGCGGSSSGGSGSVSTGGVYYTHAQLAQIFVDRLWTDAGVDVSLVKTNTLQNGYIVVFDHHFGTYDAYWISDYNVGENLNSYLSFNDPYFFYDLDVLGGNLYEDFNTGYLFERAGSNTIYDVKQLVEAATNAQTKKVAANLLSDYSEFGLNQERALALAKISGTMKISDTKILTEADYQDGLYDALGVEALDLADALVIKAETGDTKKFDQLALVIAETNELTGGIEAVNDIIAAVSAGIQ